MTIGECEAEGIRVGWSAEVMEDARRLDRISERQAALTSGHQLGGLTVIELKEHFAEVDAIQAQLVSLADDVEGRTGVRPGLGRT